MVTSHIPEPAPNSACNSPTTLSNPEIRLAELQRFQTLLKLHPIELHASFLRGGPRHRPRVPRPRRHTPRTPPPLPAGLHERNTALARHPTAWLTSSVKEISPQHGENGRKSAILGVRGRKIFQPWCWPPGQGRKMFQLGCWTPAQGRLFFLALGRGRVGGVLSPCRGGFSFSPRLVEASLMPTMRRAVRERRRREKTRPAQ